MCVWGGGQAQASTASHHLTKATSVVRATAEHRQGHGSGGPIQGCQVIQVGSKDCGKKPTVVSLSKRVSWRPSPTEDSWETPPPSLEIEDAAVLGGVYC